MFRVLSSSRGILLHTFVAMLALAGLEHASIAWSSPAGAQMSGRVGGTVLDVDGQPVEGATVIFDYQGGVTRQLEATSDGNGEYMQMGLQQGPYSVTAEKEGVGRRTEEFSLRVGQRIELDLTLVPEFMRVLSELSPEELAEVERDATLKPLLEAAVAASAAGDHGGAIARFEEGLAARPDCHECHHGIGVAHAEQEDYDNAEVAFRRSLEVNPDYAPAYEGLATIYNAQRRFDEAFEANQRAAELSGSGEAGATADPDAVFNQGLINWNAGNIEEAKAQFQQTLDLDPNHGEAHYWMGMASLNEGKLPEAKTEFERYVELEPGGRFADQARGMLTQLP